MRIIRITITILLLFFIANQHTGAQAVKLAQAGKLVQESEQAMLRSTRYMVEQVSTNGGYVWYYLPDFSRRWGEMEAYKTMI